MPTKRYPPLKHMLTVKYYNGKLEKIKCAAYELTPTLLVVYDKPSMPGSKRVKTFIPKRYIPLAQVANITDTYLPER